MKKTTKKLFSLILAFVLIFAMYVPAAAKTNDDNITVSVKIRTTAFNGGTIVSNSNVVLPTGATAMDALKAVSGGTTASSSTVGGKTYYTQGILKWYTTSWGDYISAVQVTGHSSTNRYFGNNGAAFTGWSVASGSAYSYLSDLRNTEIDLGYIVPAYSTFNNTVHEDGYLSETDYNNYSGWMTIINGSTLNNGVSTVLSEGDKVDLNFSMMMGLDLGQASYMKNSSNEWVPCAAWNTYSFN